MFLRIVSESFTRKPRRKVLTAVALALGMAVATATLEVALDVGDRLAREFRSLGANLLVTPASDTLPLEIGGVDYRPVNAGAPQRAVVLDGAFERFPRQIEAIELGITALQPGQDPESMVVVGEPTETAHLGVEILPVLRDRASSFPFLHTWL